MREFKEAITMALGAFVVVAMILFATAAMSRPTEVELQEIKPIENGYIITIDNKVYYKEVIDG